MPPRRTAAASAPEPVDEPRPEFEVVSADEVTPDDDTQPESGVEAPQDFICPGCDIAPFAKRGEYNQHIRLKHRNHPEWKIAATPKGQVVSDARDTPVRGRSKKAQTERLKRWILDEANPGIVTLAVQSGVNPLMMDLVAPPLLVKPLREEFQFSETQAALMARGVTEMNGTPIVETVVRVVGPVVPYFFGIAAIVVLGMHAWKCWTLRSMLTNPEFMGKVLAAANTSQNGAASANGSQPVHQPQFV